MILGKSPDKRRAKAAAYPFVPQAGAFPTPRCLGHQRAVQPRGAGRESLSKRGSFIKAVSETLLAPPGRKTGITKKQPPYWATAFSVGENLFSRAVTSQVSSAPASLTSVFGMGTGGPSRQSTPTVCFFAVVPDDSYIIPQRSGKCNPFFQKFLKIFEVRKCRVNPGDKH